ncbi:unnamed protein product [Colias eurytheme]|nr:unnamed protein product [Colias eurytheme]
MFSKIVLLSWAAACVFAAPPVDVVPLEKQQPTVIPIVSQSDELDANGTYKFSYETGNGIKREETAYEKVLPKLEGRSASSNEGGESDESNEIHVQRGSYSYTAPDGTVITVTYIADENGFQPIGDHIPRVPGISSVSSHSAEKSGRALKSDSAESASVLKISKLEATPAIVSQSALSESKTVESSPKPNEQLSETKANTESAPASPSSIAETTKAAPVELSGASVATPASEIVATPASENAETSSVGPTEEIANSTPSEESSTIPASSTVPEAVTQENDVTTTSLPQKDLESSVSTSIPEQESTTAAVDEQPSSTVASEAEPTSTSAANTEQPASTQSNEQNVSTDGQQQSTENEQSTTGPTTVPEEISSTTISA